MTLAVENIDVAVPVTVTSGMISLPSSQIVVAKVSGDTVSITSGQTVQLPATQVVKISGETVVLGDAGGDLVTVDSGVGGLVTIDTDHHKVHEGKAFIASHYDADSDEASCTVYTITVPVSGAYHFVVTVNADAAGTAIFKEDVLNSGGTAALTEYNANRAIGTSSLVNFATGGNFLSGGGGTTLWTGLLGADNNKTKIGGESRNGYEWVLTSGIYSVTFFPAADSTRAVINSDFYEVA